MKETLSSAETLAAAEQAALTKTKLGTRKTLVLAALAGAYIAMGGTLSLLVGYGFAQAAAGNPGLQKLLSGAMFPLGLILVVLAGAELFTGNNAVLIPGALGRRYPWKAVARNWALVYLGNFAGALLFSQWVMKKPLIQRMLGKELSLPQQVWSRLNLAWAVFFILCGLANIYIAFWLPQNIWVNFKVFGLTALTLVFTLLSGIYIYRHMPQDDHH